MATLPDLVGRLRLDMSDLSRAQSEASARGSAIGSALEAFGRDMVHRRS